MIVKLIKLKDDPKKPMYFYKYNGLKSVFHIEKRIGSESIRGTVYKVCNKGKCTALKVLSIPLDWKNVQDCPTNRITAEVKFLSWCNQLLDAGVTNNLPKTMEFYSASDSACELTNSNYSNSKKCLMFQAPLADGDLNGWLKTNPSIPQIHSAIIQVLLGIYVFRNQFNAYHRDLHLGNVLYYKEPQTTYYYKLKNKIIAVPNFGYRFVLWDFDQSFSFDMCHEFKNLKQVHDLINQYYQGRKVDKDLEKINRLHYQHSILTVTDFEDYDRFLGVLALVMEETIPKYIGFIEEIFNLVEFAKANEMPIEGVINLFIKNYGYGKYVSAAPKKTFDLDKKVKLK